MIDNMTKKTWEFMKTNRKTHDYVWTEGQKKTNKTLQS